MFRRAVFDGLDQLAQRIASEAQITGLVVAYSGGVDSHVLLVCAEQWCQQHSSTPLRAHHVDHGLQAQSGVWAQHCERICVQLQVPFTLTRVVVETADGSSPEEAARHARYAALRGCLRRGEILLTAHHVDDQAETLLLQLFRGAGVNGLASMPECTEFGTGYHARPLLQFASEDIRRFASEQKLQWIEDPSNQNPDFDRNLLRTQIMPLLQARWPSLASSIARSASHCAEAAEVGRHFARGVLGEQVDSRVLSLRSLDTLTAAEAKVVLRYWIEYHGFRMPPAVTLSQLLRAAVTSGVTADISWGDARIREFQAALYLDRIESFEPGAPFRYEWPSTGTPLTIEETGQVVTANDIPVGYRTGVDSLVVCSRCGGERLQLSGHRIHKSVKKLFQECSIPPWKRNSLPFVYADGELIGIIGIGFTD